MSKQHFDLIRGLRTARDGEIVVMDGRDKQFSAVLNGAEPGDTALVNIYACPDGDKSRRLPVATLALTAEKPADVTPIIESLIGPHYAEIDSVDSGEVWVYGDCEHGNR